MGVDNLSALAVDVALLEDDKVIKRTLRASLSPRNSAELERKAKRIVSEICPIIRFIIFPFHSPFHGPACNVAVHIKPIC
jgi:hypothetical protein